MKSPSLQSQPVTCYSCDLNPGSASRLHEPEFPHWGRDRSGPITSWQIDGETTEIVIDFFFLAPKSLQMVAAAMKLKDTSSLEEKL